MFNKDLSIIIKKHTDELVTLNLGLNSLQTELNAQILQNNRLVDVVRELSKKIDLLAKCFQLEYNGITYVKRRK